MMMAFVSGLLNCYFRWKLQQFGVWANSKGMLSIAYSNPDRIRVMSDIYLMGDVPFTKNSVYQSLLRC